MKIGVVGNPRYARLRDLLARLGGVAAEHGLELSTEADLRDLWPAEIPLIDPESALDLLLTFGGDGTLLRGVRMLQGRDTAVLGVNLGRVGFLTTATPDTIESAINAYLEGHYRVETRRTLETTLVGVNGTERAGEPALNDVVVHKAGVARVIHVKVQVDGEGVGQYSADGVIVATPTGSTAYSMSASGPVVVPDVEALVITAICPHTLAVRPIVVRGDAKVSLEIAPPTPQEVLVSFDGQVGATVALGEQVRIGRAAQSVRLIRLGSEGFFARMRSKLQWGDLSDRERE